MAGHGPLPWLKPAVFSGSLVPLAAIGVRAWERRLGANPIAELLNRLGLLALVFLVLTLDIETILKWFPLEERIYRMRCVEAWSMVIPWLGFPLAALIQKLKPTANAKYVAFPTLLD